MLGSDKLEALKQRGQKNKRHLHSPAHQLADELCTRLSDPKHFGLYLKLAEKHNHDFLRKTATEVLESANVKNPGKLFVFLVKKNSSSN
jgi:hypothetical protein